MSWVDGQTDGYSGTHISVCFRCWWGGQRRCASAVWPAEIWPAAPEAPPAAGVWRVPPEGLETLCRGTQTTCRHERWGQLGDRWQERWWEKERKVRKQRKSINKGGGGQEGGNKGHMTLKSWPHVLSHSLQFVLSAAVFLAGLMKDVVSVKC